MARGLASRRSSTVALVIPAAESGSGGTVARVRLRLRVTARSAPGAWSVQVVSDGVWTDVDSSGDRTVELDLTGR